ncbi:ribonucleoside-triphosphate reductase class III catalytic subunit [Ruminococcus sp. YE71]|uniref:anaerobic ribonucleoside triphosphate reductase n=1 Tax=unclassified Ruminococcus TaxID=2608920 RepID=UPI000885906D|nr:MULTISPECIES: anaerobic ribonucleoside triphosphate reductase [unclassified Ruminococcus]SDA24236.1 ribonucleoside-triphosphate reductase class III catalytic subunit [Ruminococcus sp. YE78]SFW41658.1 ribonucleoside-triphosphate reductase class III catalytic subunit [Ruminococcus sp. YE71]
MIIKIQKRDGRLVTFNIEKIANAIFKAAQSVGGENYEEALQLAGKVGDLLMEKQLSNPTVEQIQDCVEKVLIEEGHAQTAKSYILYRSERTKAREMNTRLMKVYEDLTFKSAKDNDLKRENANIDGDTAMGTMLKYGSVGAKEFYEMYVLDKKHAEAHAEGFIHIHDLDFYTLTTTCTQIDLTKLFNKGFSTGHGFLRTPNDISSYAALACIAIQSNQNDQHGGQSIPKFDYDMAEGVKKTFAHRYRDNIHRSLALIANLSDSYEIVVKIMDKIHNDLGVGPTLSNDNGYTEAEHEYLLAFTDDKTATKIQNFAYKTSVKETDRATYQAMEALIHNLNTMNSRAGAQTPFSSINYGTDTSIEGRMVIKNVLLAQEAGLGNGETPIFPIHIFKVKDGINFNPTDPNYDLFRLACRVSAKRLFPNFSFIDAPFNLQYYKEGNPDTEIAYMGCRTRVIGNVYDPSREIVTGRGNLSFTTVNLPRLGILADRNIGDFFEMLDKYIDLVIEQLLHRFKIQSDKRVKNYPFLMGQGIWIDSEKLDIDDKVGEVLKHGTLSMGFIGLAECLVALTGKHHGEDENSRKLGIEIITHMRERMDEESKKRGLNFSLLATPAEGLSGRFIKIDRKKYGVIKGVTDKDYYTNSFHVPVYYPINAYKKIEIEAPYHALTNAGHISYIELDGDPLNNLPAFEKIIRYMKEKGIGYGSINHPVDRDPICGYTGIIGDKCPRCGRTESEHNKIVRERLKRIYCPEEE